jgi:hypothetical protein
METLLEFVKILATPIILLILGLLLKKELHTLTLPGGTKLEFNDTKNILRKTPSLDRLTANLQAKWEKTGNIYWLGHDLMWTAQVSLRGAGKNQIIYGLKQSLHHLKSIDLKDKLPEKELLDLLITIENYLDTQIDSEVRGRIAGDVDHILDEVGAYMEANQSNFEAFAKEYRK